MFKENLKMENVQDFIFNDMVMTIKQCKDFNDVVICVPEQCSFIIISAEHDPNVPKSIPCEPFGGPVVIHGSDLKAENGLNSLCEVIPSLMLSNRMIRHMVVNEFGLSEIPMENGSSPSCRFPSGMSKPYILGVFNLIADNKLMTNRVPYNEINHKFTNDDDEDASPSPSILVHFNETVWKLYSPESHFCILYDMHDTVEVISPVGLMDEAMNILQENVYVLNTLIDNYPSIREKVGEKVGYVTDKDTYAKITWELRCSFKCFAIHYSSVESVVEGFVHHLQHLNSPLAFESNMILWVQLPGNEGSQQLQFISEHCIVCHSCNSLFLKCESTCPCCDDLL
eukprot:TRINITY_DN199270_c0_g3_i1.p1 TRINITY_DN199270_c0_g3~~TRINITY_DN199270_c0_g3_i1.p1  ORF type:complete len:357 (+),score=74.06 TRINITY_DN199270_c0_g3_i1:54-1073(+)